MTLVQDFEDVWEEPVQLKIGVMYSVQTFIKYFIWWYQRPLRNVSLWLFKKGGTWMDPLIVRKQRCEFAHIKKNNMGIVVWFPQNPGRVEPVVKEGLKNPLFDDII